MQTAEAVEGRKRHTWTHDRADMTSMREYFMQTAEAVEGRKRHTWTGVIIDLLYNHNNNMNKINDEDTARVHTRQINRAERNMMNLYGNKHLFKRPPVKLREISTHEARFYIYNWGIYKLIWIERGIQLTERRHNRVTLWSKWKKHYGIKCDIKWKTR